MKKRAYKKAKRTKLNSYWIKFKKIRNKVTTMLRDYKRLLMKNLQKNSNQNHLQQKTGDRLLNSLYSRTLRQLEVDNYIYR